LTLRKARDSLANMQGEKSDGRSTRSTRNTSIRIGIGTEADIAAGSKTAAEA
jgi:hypothetical protein